MVAAALAVLLVIGGLILLPKGNSDSTRVDNDRSFAGVDQPPAMTAAERYDRVLQKGTGGASQSHPETATNG